MTGKRLAHLHIALAAAMLACTSCQLGRQGQEAPPAFEHVGRAAGGSCVRYVDADAPPHGDGLSWHTAYRRIQAGIRAAKAAAHRSRCEVWVAEGTYYVYRHHAKDTVRLRRRVDVYGGFAGTETLRRQKSPQAHETVLDGHKYALSPEQVYHVVTGADDAVLDGFVITGGRAYGPSWKDRRGAGMINIYRSPTVRRCVFRDNAARADGGGMYNLGSSTQVEFSFFALNAAQDDGGGMYNGLGSPNINRVLFRDNTAGHDGGALYNFVSTGLTRSSTLVDNAAGHSGGGIYNLLGSPLFHNVVIYRNEAGHRGGGVAGMVACTEPVLANCVLYGNHAGQEGGGLFDVSFASTHVVNSVLWHNSAEGDHPEIYSIGSLHVTYSDVEGGYPGAGNLDEDPRFWEPDYGVFKLKPDSPLIDAGTVDLAPPFDFNGIPRVDGADIGAVEWVPTNGDLTPPAGTIFVDSSNEVPCDGSGCGTDKCTDEPLGLRDGQDWAHACKTIEGALARAQESSGAPIWVADGTYRVYNWDGNGDTATWTLKDNVPLWGGFRGYTIQPGESPNDRDPARFESILDGVDLNQNHACQILTFQNTTATPRTLDISGFTIRNGQQTDTCAAVPNEGWAGAGLRITSSGDLQANIERCRFQNNSAVHDGGAVYLHIETGDSSSVVTVLDSTFVGNSVRDMDNPECSGGAMAARGGFRRIDIQRCTFESNQVDGKLPSGGGAISLNFSQYDGDRQLLIDRSIFNGNVSKSYGGAIFAYGSGRPSARSQITRCRFTGNEATTQRGGAVWIGGRGQHVSNFLILNSIFANNAAFFDGGAITVEAPAEAEIWYSTVVGHRLLNPNLAQYLPSGVGIRASSDATMPTAPVRVVASIFYDNLNDDWLKPDLVVGDNFKWMESVDYSYVQDLYLLDPTRDPHWTSSTWYPGTRNLDSAQDGRPGFRRYTSIDPNLPYDDGTWSSNAQYDSLTDTTTLTASGLPPYPSDMLPGSFVWPTTQRDPPDRRWYRIRSVSTDIGSFTLTVEGDASPVLSTDSFRIYDLRLAPDSPCVDKQLSTWTPPTTRDFDDCDWDDVIAGACPGFDNQPAVAAVTQHLSREPAPGPNAPPDIGAMELRKAENGSPCTDSQGCISGFCTDGVCCDAACDGTCQACNLAGSQGTCVNHPADTDPEGECGTCAVCNGAGECTAAQAGTDPKDECDQEDPSPLGCRKAGDCDGAGHCSYWPAGTQCANHTCVDGQESDVSTCDANGDCEQDNPRPCDPYVCDPNDGACLTGCDDSSDCIAGDHCDATQCEAAVVNGEPCQQDDWCQNGQCVDGFCCDQACTGPCMACNVPGHEGTCADVPDGEDPDEECRGSCNGAGACACVRFVDLTSASGGDGLSWTQAFPSLQNGIDDAAGSPDLPCEVWVKRGTYAPTTAVSFDPTDSFVLAPNVYLYGGFDGTEQSRNARDFRTNLTRLSGCVRIGLDVWECVYHVVTGADEAILDGFTMTGGRADGAPGSDDNRGGGLFVDEVTNLRVANCTFRNNSGVYGGAIYSGRGSLDISRCVFIDNSARFGGAIYADRRADLVVASSLLAGNVAEWGGAIYNFISLLDASFDVVNTTFVGNIAASGGAVRAGALSGPIGIRNSILWDNTPSAVDASEMGSVSVVYSDVEGGYYGTSNIDAPPLLANVPKFWDRSTGSGGTDYLVVATPSRYQVNDIIELSNDGIKRTVDVIDVQARTITFSPARSTDTPEGMLVENWDQSPEPGSVDVDEDYHLLQESPCINTGSSDVNPPPLDLDGNPRCGDPDMGAYEYQAQVCE